ncbi:MFS transporter, partial [Burkholderia pseudomallei]
MRRNALTRGIPPSPPARQPRRAAGAAFAGTTIEGNGFYMSPNGAAAA